MATVGAFSSLWQFATNTAMADPGTKHFRLDNATTPTQMALSSTDDDGVDRHGLVVNLTAGDYVIVRSTQTQGNWLELVLATVPTDLTTWFLMNVTLKGTGANYVPPGGNDRLLFDWWRYSASTAWITKPDVAEFLGIPTAAAADDGWLDQCTLAANDVAFRRRAAAGYVDDPAVVPDEAVRTGCVVYAGSLYRERGAVDGYASFVELGTFVPAGGSWGQIQKLWGVLKMQVG